MKTKAPARGTGTNADPSSAQQKQRPFCMASKHALSPAITYPGFQPGANAVNLGPSPLPASGGYLRRLLMEFVYTGGAGSGILQADGPFSTVGEVRLLEPNGTPILDLSGWNLLLANIYGGYVGVNDPRNDPDYTTGSGNNPVFTLFLPIELDTTGRGALSDLSSSSAFQVYLNIANAASIWSTNPTTVPSLALNIYQDYWTLPWGSDQDGNQQQTAPPFPGTIQLWSQIPNISIASNQRVQLNRMGNQLRVVAMVFRSGGARSETPVPNPLAFRWDDVIIDNVDLIQLRKIMREYVNGLTVRDTGVYVLPYNFGLSRFVGGNGISSYMPTVTATRYEISGPNGGGTVDWVINEVTSAPVSAVQRTSVGGGLQFYPPAPAPAPAGTM